MIKAPPRTLLEVFESLPEGTLCQLINHQLIRSPAPSLTHQRLLKTIFGQLDAFVTKHQMGEVLFAPLDVYLDSGNIYQPDILFISNARRHIIQDKIKGAPDLVIEILSPGNEWVDQKDKKGGYEKNGVQEYWMVHPVSKQATGYWLSENQYEALPAGQGSLTSPLLQLRIDF